MVLLHPGDGKELVSKRRENKKMCDLLRKAPFKHEVNVVFNRFYKKQVEALYREISVIPPRYP